MIIQDYINDPKVLNIYQWGSRVYGCFTDKSDYDYNIIVSDDYENFINNIEVGDIHMNFYKLSTWLDMIKLNRIEVLECLFADEQFILKESMKFDLVINQVELRKSISQICSNAYDKARKKLIITKDFVPYTAKKSLWHCIRILLFGIQCARDGKITDYSEANKYYNEIVRNESNDWFYYKANWHVFCNNLRSEFRKYSEEEWIKWKNRK